MQCTYTSLILATRIAFLRNLLTIKCYYHSLTKKIAHFVVISVKIKERIKMRFGLVSDFRKSPVKQTPVFSQTHFSSV